MFRVKVMTAGEWADFEINVANIVLGAGDHRHALFREAGNLADPGRILIASPDPGIVEALSPGGWSDCADASERTWMFLVGDNAAEEQFGLRSEESRVGQVCGSSCRSRG